MKKFLIGSLFIGLASLGFSQSSNIGLEEVKLADVTITPLNADYLDNVGESLSPWVFTLERKASRFNLKESRFFNPDGRSEIHFTQRKGKIIAIYDRNGKIVSTRERYINLMLPPTVRNSVFKSHPGWTMVENAFLVSYRHNKGAKKIYKVKIAKGNLQKKLKIDTEGTLL